MGSDALRYPVDVISVVLNDSTPVNDDVAFALVSRFNVRMRTEKTERRAHLAGRHLAESADYEQYWLRRLELFEQVCIPSVMNLTPLPDAWFIAFGDMESWFVRELLDRLRPYPWIRPFFRKKGHPDDAGPTHVLLSEFAQSLGKPYVCSTRFDSDDSLHRQFIGGLDLAITHLRKRGDASEPHCLNFLYGLLESKGELSVFLRRNNMFQSVIEAVERIGGPYAGGHDDVRERMPLIEIVTNLPMWIYHRHDQTMEPAWVTGQRLLPLPDARAILPSFGLTSTDYSKPPVGPGDADARRDASARQTEAAGLRGAPYWDANRFSEAVELASASHQTELSRWLAPRNAKAADPVQVLQEFDSANLPILNGAQLARLARELDASGETGLALRAFDYALVAGPSNQHIRAERDALAGELAARLDFDEQMEIHTEAGSIEPCSNSVVFVISSFSDDGESENPDRVLDRAGHLARSGFSVTIVVVPSSFPPAPLTAAPEGVTLQVLPIEPPLAAGSDALHRELLRQLARRVSKLGPDLLVADGTSVAQRLAASVGRGLGIPVDFGGRI